MACSMDSGFNSSHLSILPATSTIGSATQEFNKCKQAADNTGLKDCAYSGCEKFRRLNDYCRRVLSRECLLNARYMAFEEMYKNHF